MTFTNSPLVRAKKRATWSDIGQATPYIRPELRACRNCTHFRTPDRRDRCDDRGVCRLLEQAGASQGMLPGLGSAHFVPANHVCDRWEQLTDYQAEHA